MFLWEKVKKEDNDEEERNKFPHVWTKKINHLNHNEKYKNKTCAPSTLSINWNMTRLLLGSRGLTRPLNYWRVIISGSQDTLILNTEKHSYLSPDSKKQIFDACALSQ